VKLALLAAGLAVVLDASPSAADIYPRQPGVNALHYVFRLTLADGSREIAGKTTAMFRFERDGVGYVVQAAESIRLASWVVCSTLDRYERSSTVEPRLRRSPFGENTNQLLAKTTRPENVDGQSVPVKSASIRVA